MRDEVLLAEAPVEEQVFGEEGGGYHTKAIMHVCGAIEAAHRGIDNRVTLGNIRWVDGDEGWGVNAKTTGYEANSPVRPSVQRRKCSSLYSHSMFVYSYLKGLFILEKCQLGLVD